MDPDDALRNWVSTIELAPPSLQNNIADLISIIEKRPYNVSVSISPRGTNGERQRALAIAGVDFP
jgi:hypothetical protein